MLKYNIRERDDSSTMSPFPELHSCSLLQKRKIVLSWFEIYLWKLLCLNCSYCCRMLVTIPNPLHHTDVKITSLPFVGWVCARILLIFFIQYGMLRRCIWLGGKGVSANGSVENLHFLTRIGRNHGWIISNQAPKPIARNIYIAILIGKKILIPS